MSQNKVDKVIKNILPVGSYISFSNDIDPNNLFEGNWSKLGSYTNIIQYNSIELAKDISGTTATSKTGLLGCYFDSPIWYDRDFISNCPGGYHPAFRLIVYGYTESNNRIAVYLNNKSVQLCSWGPTTFIQCSTSAWWNWDTLTAEDTTYGLERMGKKGLNLYYEVSSPNEGWKIHYIKLDLGFMPNNSMIQWVRTS